jgi:hypothetical protein
MQEQLAAQSAMNGGMGSAAMNNVLAAAFQQLCECRDPRETPRKRSHAPPHVLTRPHLAGARSARRRAGPLARARVQAGHALRPR